MRTLVWACLFAASVVAVPVRAELPPQPVELAQALPGATVLGQKRLKVWGFEVYDARLWTLPGFAPSNFETQALALELHYLRDFASRDIAKRSLKEMRRAGALSPAQAERWLAEMQRVFPNVKKGDRLLGRHQPGQGAAFWLNGQRLGEIADAEFSQRFFGIWLSAQTSEPALRQALLGPLR